MEIANSIPFTPKVNELSDKVYATGYIPCCSHNQGETPEKYLAKIPYTSERKVCVRRKSGHLCLCMYV